MASGGPNQRHDDDEALLFEQVSDALGLSPAVATGLVRRALADCGVTADFARPSDYHRMAPKLAARMRAYADAGEVSRRIAHVQGVVLLWEHRHPSGPRSGVFKTPGGVDA